MRDVFAKSFEHGEVGAALAVTIAGRAVVDLWGGHRDAARTQPWTRDTLVNVYSTTKGITAICANRLVERGLLDLDAPVAPTGPSSPPPARSGFRCAGCSPTRRACAALREDVPLPMRFDWKFWTEALAAEAPWWEPGTQHGYHALTFGHLVGEVVRRVDGRSLGRYFREELGEPLGLDFHIGLAAEHDARVAEILPAPKSRAGRSQSVRRRAQESALPGRARVRKPDARARGREHTRVAGRRDPRRERPRHGARPRALYGALACGGAVDGVQVLSPEQIARANTEQARGLDAVLAPMHSRFGLGFMLTQPMIPLGPNPRSFGHPGVGGSIAFADPDAQLGFAYTMNQMQTGLGGDARGFALIGALYTALRA